MGEALRDRDRQMLGVLDAALDKLESDFEDAPQATILEQVERLVAQAKLAYWSAASPRAQFAEDLDRLLAMAYSLRREIL